MNFTARARCPQALLLLLIPALLVVSRALAAPGKPPPAAAWGTLAEVQPTAFQRTAIAKDLPLTDLLFDGPGSLMLLGRSSLWRWQPGVRSLRRLDLSPALPGPWEHLGSDGHHLYAGGPAGLVQILWDESRLFRLNWPAGLATGPGSFLGFVGQGDDFWLAQTAALLHFDRYGRTFGPTYAASFLHGGEHFALAPATRRLWFTQGKRLRRLDLAGLEQTPADAKYADTKTAAAEPKTMLAVKHELLALQVYGDELITHTRHTVLRLDQNGKIKHSIPVEGGRELVAMCISPEAHAYAFDDHMLEIFYPREQRAERFHLPLAEGDKVSKLAVQAPFVAVLSGDSVRLFRLDSDLGTR